MSAIAVSADGNQVYLALETGAGLQIFARADRSDLSAWSQAYSPGAGTAANVVAAGEDVMLFYGSFGTDAQIVKHIISTGANSNISPASLGTKVVNCLAVNPSDPNELWATVDTNQDLLRSTDQGAAWETLNAALGINPTALLVLWAGEYDLDRAYLAGNTGAAEELLYTVDEGASCGDYAGAGLGAVADVVGVEGVGL